MKTLTLSLKHKWFDMIKSDEKKVPVSGKPFLIYK